MNELSAQILEFVKTGNKTIKEITDHLKVSRGTATRVLNDLKASNQVYLTSVKRTGTRGRPQYLYGVEDKGLLHNILAAPVVADTEDKRQIKFSFTDDF